MPNMPVRSFLPKTSAPTSGASGTFTNPESISVANGLVTGVKSGQASAPSGGGATNVVEQPSSPATALSLGTVEMSTAPVDPTTPIAVGDNDPRVAAFVGAGASATSGLVPNPGATAHSPIYWLGEDSAFHAQTSITNLGIVVVGTWHATAIAAQYGGTGIDTSAAAIGATLYTSATGTWSTLAGNTTSTRKFLRQVGNGTVSAAPAWDTLQAGDLPIATAASLGAVQVDGSTITITSGGVISATAGTGSIPFPAWNNSTAYTTGQVVYGSDGNLYRATGNSTGGDPTINVASWCLYALLANLTLNCGPGARFADNYALSNSPGGAMTPGMQAAHDFIAKAVGAVSPAQATITIQQANNPSTTCSAAGTTTTVKTTVNIPIGASLVFKGDVTGALAGATTTVTASSFSSGTYTLTVNTLSNAPATNDTFYYAPYYGTTTVTINLPTIGGNVLVQGSTNTVAATTTEPSLTTATTGGSMPTSTYYASITLSWTDSTGTIRESLPGPITSLTVGSGGSANTLTCAGFTLPTGASGANLYVSNSSGGTLHKQASFSVTGGVASNLTITSYNSGGASAPTTNAPASCWPCACMWGNANGIAIYGARGIQFNGFYLYGPGTSTYNGVSIGSTNSSPAGADTGASILFGAASVVSNWSAGFTSGEFGSYFDVSSVQIDNCASGCSTFNGVHFRANNINAIRCTTGISLSQFSTGVVNGANVAFCTTGFNAAYGAQMKTLPSNPASGTYQPTYGCTTAANPAFNTQGTAMSYISNS